MGLRAEFERTAQPLKVKHCGVRGGKPAGHQRLVRCEGKGLGRGRVRVLEIRVRVGLGSGSQSGKTAGDRHREVLDLKRHVNRRACTARVGSYSHLLLCSNPQGYHIGASLTYHVRPSSLTHLPTHPPIPTYSLLLTGSRVVGALHVSLVPMPLVVVPLLEWLAIRVFVA